MSMCIHSLLCLTQSIQYVWFETQPTQELVLYCRPHMIWTLEIIKKKVKKKVRNMMMSLLCVEGYTAKTNERQENVPTARVLADSAVSDTHLHRQRVKRFILETEVFKNPNLCSGIRLRRYFLHGVNGVQLIGCTVSSKFTRRTREDAGKQ